jgi:enoyl-CoA hydratase/carnithine racemase
MANESVLRETVAEHIDLITINRPDARNAVNGDVALGIAEAVEATENDPEVWVVVLTGAGDKAFCAGADLKAVARGGFDNIATSPGGFAGFIKQPRTKPWIAAVKGFALAGGFEIALACDLIVAAEESSFGLPEVKRGLMAAGGGLHRLSRAMPRALALELIMTGASFGARDAFLHGLVNRVVPQNRVIEEAVGLARLICENAPLAVRASLRVARQAFDLTDTELLVLSIEATRSLESTDDFKEGPLAFIEKRLPRWTAT